MQNIQTAGLSFNCLLGHLLLTTISLTRTPFPDRPWLLLSAGRPVEPKKPLSLQAGHFLDCGSEFVSCRTALNVREVTIVSKGYHFYALKLVLRY